MMIFSKLSTDSQLAIFSHLPPGDQLLTRLVCRCWAALQVTRRRKSLTLLFGPLEHTAAFCTNKIPYPANIEATRLYLQWSGLFAPVDGLTQSRIQQLLVTFPNITTLSVILPDDSLNPFLFDQCLALLSQLTTQLTSLKILSSFRISNDIMGHNHACYLRTLLNSCTKLKHLTLSLGHELGTNFDLPVLRQLKSFYFSSNNITIDVILPSLRQYAEQSDHLQYIGIGNGFGAKTLEALLQLSPQLLARFTVLPANVTVGLDAKQLSTLSLNFPNLTSLTIQETRWDVLTESLTTFPHLTFLRLHTRGAILASKTEPKFVFPQIIHLEVVQSAFMEGDNLYAFHLGVTFPRLQFFSINEPRGKMNIAKFLRPLAQCFHLQLIVLRSVPMLIPHIPFKSVWHLPIDRTEGR